MPQQASQSESWLGPFLSDGLLRCCAVFALVIVLMPPDGVPGLDICFFKRMTGAPCPGCGMTRCGSCLLRGEFRRAMAYHPFGIVVIPFTFVCGAIAFAPRPWRDATRSKLSRWDRLLWLGLWIGGGSLLLFGWFRWLAVYLEWNTFSNPGW